jgi:hypothetical protein
LECNIFGKAILNENDTLSKEANSVISIPDCDDEKIIWLKRPFQIQPPTNEESENSKYV